MRTCTETLRLGATPAETVLCGMPAPYMVVTVDTQSGWTVVNWRCAGCAATTLTTTSTGDVLLGGDQPRPSAKPSDNGDPWAHEPLSERPERD